MSSESVNSLHTMRVQMNTKHS